MSESLKHLAIKLDILNEEIEIIQKRILPEDCGHLKTAVSVIRERVKEVKSQIYDWNE